MKINNKGFTLIEMLVVVAIVGLLSAVVVVGLTGAREQARDSRRVADIRQIQNDLEINYQSSSGYPSPVNGHPPGEPVDPQDNNYLYELADEGFSYRLGIELETEENSNYEEGNCPSSITGGPAFCVTPGSGGSGTEG